MAKKMTVKVAYELFGAVNLITTNPLFEMSLRDIGYAVNYKELDKLRGEAALVIALDAFKKAGWPTNLIVPQAADPGR